MSNVGEAFDKMLGVIEIQQRTINKLIEGLKVQTSAVEALDQRIKFLEVVR